jgi:hypothetical protein
MANKPKLEFLLNVPTVIVLGNNFKNGNGEYGPWFGWGITENGVEKTLFADSDLQAKIAPFGKGAQLTITKSQIPGTRQFAWSVQPVGAYAPPGVPVLSPPPLAPATAPPIARNGPRGQNQNGGWDREAYRSERVARAREAIADAESILDAATWSREDVRALAISFLIDEQRQGIAPPDDGPAF